MEILVEFVAGAFPLRKQTDVARSSSRYGLGITRVSHLDSGPYLRTTAKALIWLGGDSRRHWSARSRSVRPRAPYQGSAFQTERGRLLRMPRRTDISMLAANLPMAEGCGGP